MLLFIYNLTNPVQEITASHSAYINVHGLLAWCLHNALTTFKSLYMAAYCTLQFE